MMESIEKLRKSLKACTSKAGVEPNQFDTYWITAKACDMLIDKVEAEIAERYMKLPCDCDGVPIHVGDYLKLGRTRGRVIALTYCPCNELPWEWQCDSDSDWYNTAFTRHAEPRTVEDVLADFARDLTSDRTDSYEHRIERLGTKYADELRELLGGDAE